MRLADHLMTEIGGNCDIGGIFTKTCAAIRQAERFELSDDVARAAYNLTKSKPSTLLNALPLSRAPYRKLWLEWRGGLTSDMIDPKNKRDPSWAPDPLKQGCLIETDATGQYGTMTFCWLHKERPERLNDELYTSANISPLGTLFNWDESGRVFDDAKLEFARRYPTLQDLKTNTAFVEASMIQRYSKEQTDDDAKKWMERSVYKDWSRFAGIESERAALLTLQRHGMPFIVSHAHGFFSWCAEQAMRSEAQATSFIRTIVQGSWEADIEGESPFVETVIAMMNSRNAIENRPVDLSGLNKARAKRKRPLFLPYQTTHLRLSQAQKRAFRAGLLSKEDAGRHRVRGHFKIRRTGVYWWSQFFRGDPSKPLERSEYKVDL